MCDLMLIELGMVNIGFLQISLIGLWSDYGWGCLDL